jgi:hypothetical protein
VGKSKNQVLEGFYSRALNNFRDIYIYLPSSYDYKLDKRYPILYMHDGQNLFYGHKSLSGESWNMHKTTDRLVEERKIEEIIIVGISSNEDRWEELIHYEPQVEDMGRLGTRPVWRGGEAEGHYIDNARKYQKLLVQAGYKPNVDLVYYEAPEAAHSEVDWAARVHAPLIYFFGDIGNASKCELYGRTTVGVRGMKARINTVVEFDSGFMMTDINGNYISGDSNLIEIETDGTIIAKECGKIDVIYRFNELRNVKEFILIEELSEFVDVSLKVTVPASTLENDSVNLLGVPLQKLGKDIYGGDFRLPRDWMISFRFTRGWVDKVEVSADRKTIPHRLFKASEHAKLTYVIENWADL